MVEQVVDPAHPPRPRLRRFLNKTLRNVTVAELTKLRTLPAVPITITTTVLGTAALAAVFAASALRQPAVPPHLAASAVLDTGLQAILYGQIGFILLGIFAMASEYGGNQIRTTLVSIPNRISLIAGKTVAYLAGATLTALITVAALVTSTQTTLSEHGARVSDFFTARNLGTMLGATAYLVLIGLFANSVDILVRSLVTTLVMMLTLVLVLSPFLATITPVAAYLPDRAGSLLYQTVPTPSPIHGAVIMGAWVAAMLTVAITVFTKRDA
ncbi:ABC transporter permease [Amycolatopsis taiwanensis]|uniref:ABC transporter permease n=1 Tax=Amycolatopsis taiwanensis TaxID=342230 RepID=UPI0004BAF253|nr:ABC transporter permease [Amycolatopsis taiwanensis]